MAKRDGMTARERATETRQRAIAVCVLLVAAAPVLLVLAVAESARRLVSERIGEAWGQSWDH